MDRLKGSLFYLKDRVKQNFLSGILVLVPVVATIWVIILIVRTMDSFLKILPYRWRPDNIVGFHIPGLGLIFTFLIIFAAGVIARNYAGKRVISIGENLLSRIPFIKVVYSAAKKFIQTVFSTTSGVKLGTPVMVEFPRKGIFSLGFMTGKAMGEISRTRDKEHAMVFIPTTPNVSTGFFIIVPREEVTPLSMSGQDIFQVILSAGLALPEKEGEGGER